MRVLVVDDEHPCLDEMVYLLSKQDGIEIVGTMTSSLKALEVSPAMSLDMAFLDLVMPHMGGVELAEKMLANNPGLKIVFVTAFGKELAKLRNSPAVGRLLKPVSEAKLRELLLRIRDEEQ